MDPNQSNYDKEVEKAISFLSSFIKDKSNKYVDRLMEVAEFSSHVLRIDLEDLISVYPTSEVDKSERVSSISYSPDVSETFHDYHSEYLPPSEKDFQFPSYDKILKNTKNYVNVFQEAAIKLLSTFDITKLSKPSFIIEERLSSSLEPLVSPVTSSANPSYYGASSIYKFEVKFVLPSYFPSLPIRELDAFYIGRLVRVKGVVSRASAPKPLARSLTYLCSICGKEITQVITTKTFTPLSACPSDLCRNKATSGGSAGMKAARLILQTRASHFVESQEVRIQEDLSEVPVGNVPKSLTVLLVGDCLDKSESGRSGETPEGGGTRKNRVAPGDRVAIDGVWLPLLKTGFAALRSGLTTSTYLEGMYVNTDREELGLERLTLDPQTHKKNSRKQPSNVFDSVHPLPLQELISKFNPSLYGHEDIKEALLLLLVGAPTTSATDGVRIRGNINILLVGDPGLGKSQFLSYVSKLSPRGVQTTGRSSSGVGLTASVIREKTGSVLEGGSLVMADEGVCCIDEFDKMNEEDRVGIHEVMEQQTVSIAKGGITATLNARTSVLAAANPVYGRYNDKKSIESNVGLETALLSRFDLIFVLVDKFSVRRDSELARHVTEKISSVKGEDNLKGIFNENVKLEKISVEEAENRAGPKSKAKGKFKSPQKKLKELQSSEHTESQENELFLKRYIAKAKTFTPKLPEDVHEFLARAYTVLRSNAELIGKKRFPVTPRVLVSVIRLSQALARLRFSHEVSRRDVEEALRLLEDCSDVDKQIRDDTEEAEETEISDLKEMVLALLGGSEKGIIQKNEILNRMKKLGINSGKLGEVLMKGVEEKIWVLNKNGETIYAISD